MTDKAKRVIERVLDDEEQRKIDSEWNKKPWWKQLEEAGDYSVEDSGINNGDREE